MRTIQVIQDWLDQIRKILSFNERGSDLGQ